MARVVIGIVHELGAGAQPDPVAGGAADAELVVDERCLGGCELIGERVEILVVGMNHGVHFAEGQELVAAVVAEKLVHRVRPVDAAARDVPIPQSAASAVKGGIDAVAHLLADFVCDTRALRLHEIGKPDRRGARRLRLREAITCPRVLKRPRREHARQRLDDRDLARRGGKRPHGRDPLLAGREPDRHDAGPVGEEREGLCLAEEVGQRRRMRCGRRMGREHAAERISQEHDPSARERAGGQFPHEGARAAPPPRCCRPGRHGRRAARLRAKRSRRCR